MWEAAIDKSRFRMVATLDKAKRIVHRHRADARASRVWAVDLSKGNSGSAPKFYIVATVADFLHAYVRVPAAEWHAYEMIADVDSD